MPKLLDGKEAEHATRAAFAKCVGTERLYVTRSPWTGAAFVGARRLDADAVETRHLFDVTDAAARQIVGLGLAHDHSLGEEFS